MSNNPPNLNPDLYYTTELCTKDTCPIKWAPIQYIPSLAGNALFVAIFSVLLAAHVGLGVFYRTWGFLTCMFFGISLEVMGYAARIKDRSDPFVRDWFLMNIICLTIGPAFLAGAIYLSLGRIIQAEGDHLSRLKPRNYTITFISFDFISLLLQAIGGALASTTPDDEKPTVGINIMIAGLSFQVFSLIVFSLFWAHFTMRIRRTPEAEKAPQFAALRSSRKYRGFIPALWIATIAILIRSIYRVVELSAGYDSKIANDEVVFMILEGPLIIIAAFALTVFHPALVFGRENWRSANWSLRKKGLGDKGVEG